MVSWLGMEISVFFGRAQHTRTGTHLVIVHLGDVAGGRRGAHWL
jgi:hypothetical protein